MRACEQGIGVDEQMYGEVQRRGGPGWMSGGFRFLLN